METQFSELKFQIVKPGKQLEKVLPFAVQNGKALLVEGCTEQLDAVLDSLLIKSNIVQHGGQRIVTIGNTTVEFDKNFKLYLICQMPNPHYTPEVLIKTNLLNFTITPEAAKDQMLSILASIEDEALEKEKAQLVLEGVDIKKRQKGIEDSILNLLQKTEGEAILEDNTLIDILKDSKKLSQEVDERQREAKFTEERVVTMRTNLSPVSSLASAIYFTVLSLSK